MHDIREYNISEQDLKKKLLESLQEQFNIRLQLSSGKLKKTHLIKKVRKKIARIKTLLTDRINNKS
ncbi:50S ribosomal protein L29 [Buchnera aphidicola]|uniref:Large ribosomal subunit protein uL29 n=1 Tax=Buchnera aphidicola (Cinara laricifoliae) TaxID=2518977 RepID=A0A451DBP5_9GAMM|nr:50S ribosomal protein L29 [Buchnera aphidicola]VFP83816.1 50S ribosomal protein L29 [Buchnera aphidicola (Cinara laricifoliae)]